MTVLHKLISFDLDGTLSESKQQMTEEMSSLLSELSTLTKVAVISGGSFEQLKKQLLIPEHKYENIILLPAEGSKRYEYESDKSEWKLSYKEDLPKDLREKIVKSLNKIISSGKYDIPEEHFGEYVEDRDTEIAFSALGQNAPLEKKREWDPDSEKRQKIKAEVEREIPEVEGFIAGTTSIDITRKGFSKAKSLSLLIKDLGLDEKETVFVGDAIFPGGNDYSVTNTKIETIKVSGPKETGKIIKEWIDKGKGRFHKFPKEPIAFFCMEYAISDDSSMYAGGLGILAGDYLFEAADQNLPLFAIGLKYGASVPVGFSFIKNGNEDMIVYIPAGEGDIKAKVWHKEFSENTHMFLLDTNIPENSEENKSITSHLYDLNPDTFLKQQLVLGVGGVRLINSLGANPKVFHLNEGHTSMAALAIMAERKDDMGKIVATKHTILSEAGQLSNFFFLKGMIEPYCKKFSLDFQQIFEKGKYELNPELFSTTQFLISNAVRGNAVSKSHSFFEKKKHSNSTLFPITNGVYRKRWQAVSIYDRLKTLSDEDLWNVKKRLRMALIAYIEETQQRHLNPDVCTLVWARRFAIYKRPYLLFSERERLLEMVTSQHMPLQIIVSGKSHEADKEGREILERIVDLSKKEAKNRIVYMPDYSVSLAMKLDQGADVWLNTPEPGKEACGTSGMKSGLNGALQFSVSDGWVDEVSWEGKGWILPNENTQEALYDMLEHEVLPCFYNRTFAGNPESFPREWVSRMRKTIELVESGYTTDRMLSQYIRELYKIIK